MRLFAFAATATVLTLAACTQLSKSTCEEGDWLAIGQRDGVRGRDALFVNRHVESCGKHGIAVDRAVWEQGRQQGLRVFCTPQSQYELGRDGRAFNRICAVENLPEHRAAYDKGRRYYELTRDIESLRADLRHARSADGSQLEALMIWMDIDRLERQRRQYETY